jgi:uncharacterized protein (DUF1330 family)
MMSNGAGRPTKAAGGMEGDRMSWRSAIWMVLGALAITLASGCTSDSGDNDTRTNVPTMSPTSPATDEVDQRIDEILSDGGPSFGEFNREQLRAMATIEEDAPFYMVNFIKFREFAAYPDGRDATLTGREANARYNALPIILEIGGRPVFVGAVEQQLLGDETTWDQVAIVEYPSREAFISMLERPDFRETSIHKDAGVEKSIVLVTAARDLPPIPPADPATLPFPPTADDTAFTMVHLMQFADQSGAGTGAETDGGAIAEYEQAVAAAALPLGIRPAAILEVEAALVGDGREWNEVRLNRFPSHAAFRALTEDPAWQAQQANRASALGDTYALMTLPIINAFAQP